MGQKQLLEACYRRKIVHFWLSAQNVQKRPRERQEKQGVCILGEVHLLGKLGYMHDFSVHHKLSCIWVCTTVSVLQKNEN